MKMSGFDNILANRLDETIRKNLGEKTINKIEKRLQEKYSISLLEGMNEFNKIDTVLREFFGAGALGLEKKFLEKLCKSKNFQNSTNCYQIDDKVINQEILEAYGDEDSSKILNSVVSDPKIISEILDHCRLPQTSGYRKIKSLIEKGLLLKSGEVLGKDGRIINQYRTVFENIKINIVKGKISIQVQFSDTTVNHSTILQVVLSL